MSNVRVLCCLNACRFFARAGAGEQRYGENMANSTRVGGALFPSTSTVCTVTTFSRNESGRRRPWLLLLLVLLFCVGMLLAERSFLRDSREAHTKCPRVFARQKNTRDHR